MSKAHFAGYDILYSWGSWLKLCARLCVCVCVLKLLIKVLVIFKIFPGSQEIARMHGMLHNFLKKFNSVMSNNPVN